MIGDSDLRLALGFDGLAMILAMGAWWSVFRKPKDDWLGTAALLTAVVLAINAFIVLAILL